MLAYTQNKFGIAVELAGERNMKLSKEEQEILESVERGEWKRVDNFAEERDRLKAAAAATLRDGQQVTVRLTAEDQRLLEEKAAEEGLSQQTLLSIVIHKYVNGTLKAS